MLRAQYAQQQLDELALELERQYGLLGLDVRIDVQTGKVQANRQTGKPAQPDDQSDARKEVTHGSADDARQSAP